jgi:phosphate starvation-inducible membrane PsiE
VGPNILLKIFLSKTNNFWIMVSFNTDVSETQVTNGLITFLYNFNFDCLVTNLLLKIFRFA